MTVKDRGAEKVYRLILPKMILMADLCIHQYINCPMWKKLLLVHITMKKLRIIGG